MLMKLQRQLSKVVAGSDHKVVASCELVATLVAGEHKVAGSDHKVVAGRDHKGAVWEVGSDHKVVASCGLVAELVALSCAL